MRLRWQILILTGFLLLGALLTYSNLRGTRVDAVLVDLGVQPEQRQEAREVDEEVLRAVERRYFGAELRKRLSKASTIVQLDTFLIDRCEVKQIDYERFVEWSGIRSDSAKERESPLWSKSTGDRIAGRLQSPATGMSSEAASLYCEALGGRLPWSEELEAAAGGHEARLYPWGNQFTADPWPYGNPDRNSQQQCGAHPSTSTPDGIHDLASNAMEWSQGPRTERPGQNKTAVHGAPAVRASGRELYALNAAWLPVDAQTRSHHLGFRCVYRMEVRSLPPWGGVPPDVSLVRGGHYRIGLPPDIRLARLAALLPQELHDRFHVLVAENSQETRLRVDRCEVTRTDYAGFLRDPMVRLGWFGNENEPSRSDYQPLGWHSQLEDPSLPVTGLDWWSADAYARWAGGRLPTIDEWQRIAAGAAGKIYPWGDSYDPSIPIAGDGPNATVSVCGTAKLDTTPDAISDLAGNVSEWTRTVGVERGRLAMWVAGGNWILPGIELSRSVSGRKIPLSHRSAGIGLRVVYD